MTSANYRMWMTIDDPKRCPDCKRLQGKIYHRRETIKPRQPIHLFCRCKITWLRALLAGTATDQGMDGADWWLKNYGKLPEYYITEQEAKKLGWDSELGNLYIVCPGKTLARGEYRNKNGHLPSAPGRIWYEADINYRHGFRGLTRIVYSNDGLIFVPYDHYVTFIEIV